MMNDKSKFVGQIPRLDLSEGADMLKDFSREAQRHLISARNSLLVLETVPSDKEAIENVFKTFHTIKGLADFLKLEDIHQLTQEGEIMLDMVRKAHLSLEGELARLTADAISGLQHLLELLDEQIAQNGELKRDYYDVGPCIAAIGEFTHKKLTMVQSQPAPASIIPTISFEPDMSLCAQLEEKLAASSETITVAAPSLKKLLEDFRHITKELKETQGKLQERQRELIKERELAIKLTQQAQNEARSKSEYLANMSHEIRTLINAILGFTDILRETQLTTKQRDHINTIIMSGKLLLGIVNDILDYAKVEAGKLKLEKIDFNIDRIVEEIFKIIRTRLNKKPIDLYFYIAKDVPRDLLGDPTRLKQIFINLLENAIKFTEGGEIGLSISRREGEAASPSQPSWLRFVVNDTGIGIPKDRQKMIFESFTQADTSTTRLYGGTGLGLALCKSFVEMMGGRIWVESEMSKGSRFIFEIPLRKGKPAGEREGLSLDGFAGKEVVIIDGHESAAKSLQEACQDFKLKVLLVGQTAKQGSEFLLQQEREHKNLPGIVFIDTMLPNKEGFMLAYKIKQQERYKGIKLAAISSDVKVDTTQEFQMAGFDDILPKPIIKEELVELLLRLWGKKKEHRVLSQEALQKISCEGLRILVVEDSAPNQELLKVHFESLRCVCDYAGNGQEAIEKVRNNSYDICFMDLQMPVLGGIEAAKVIRRELKSGVPIVALTAAEIVDERQRCLEAGMNDYLPKPFGVDELKEKIVRCTQM